MNKKFFIFLAVLFIGVAVWYKLRMPRYITGEQAPDFQTTLIDGTPFHFSELKGKYVLLQFWGSWCGPCRRENPQLVQLYGMYHNRGFEIVSIALERNADLWKRAIEHDQMTWKYHASDLQDFDGALPKLFNIKSIPTTFLVDPEGKIVGVDLQPAEIGERLGKALTN